MPTIEGMWFWYDAAGPQKRAFYHGQVVALVGDYCLLRFDGHAQLPDGLHEIVHVSAIAQDAWSLFVTEAELRQAISNGTAG